MRLAIAVFGLALALSPPAIAQVGVSVEGRYVTDQGQEYLEFSGSFSGLEKKKYRAQVTLTNALSSMEFGMQLVPCKGGRFEGRFGPFEKPLWPSTYALRIQSVADPEDAKPGAFGSTVSLSLDTMPPPVTKTVQVRVRTDVPLEKQKKQIEDFFRGSLESLRGLYVEMEKGVPDFKARYEKDAKDVAEATRWYERWSKQAQALVGATSSDKTYLECVGNPFVAEYQALARAADRLAYFGRRSVINITGKEGYEPGDRGKSLTELDAAGKLPSRMVREQFLSTLALAYETTQLPDPNRALVARAAEGLHEAFLALHRAWHTDHLSGDGKWMARYEEYRGKSAALIDEVDLFFKDRRNVFPGERKLQAEVLRLQGFLVCFEDLLATYQKAKKGEAKDEEIGKIEGELVRQLVRGAVALAVPAAKMAHTHLWGTYQVMIDYPDGIPELGGRGEVTYTEPARLACEEELAKGGRFAEQAARFLREVGEATPGVSSILGIADDTRSILDDIARLQKICEDVESKPKDKRQARAGEAKLLAEDLTKRIQSVEKKLEKLPE